MNARARSAINSIVAAEIGRQEGRTGTTDVSRSTGQKTFFTEDMRLVSIGITGDHKEKKG